MLLGLGHTARAGKDTIADILVDDYGFERIAFADALRELVYRTHPDIAGIVDSMGWDQAKTLHPHVRTQLVETGNVVREVINADAWVEAAFNRVDNDRHFVITDVRYPNEAHAVLDHGGILVKVTRPGFPPLDNVADQALVDWTDWTTIIVNDRTIADLRIKVRAMMHWDWALRA